MNGFMVMGARVDEWMMGGIMDGWVDWIIVCALPSFSYTCGQATI